MAKSGFGGSDLLYIGLGVAAIYAAYKFTNSATEGVSKATDGLGAGIGQIGSTTGDVFGRGGEAAGSLFDIYDTAFDKINDMIKKIGTGSNSGVTPKDLIDVNLKTNNNSNTSSVSKISNLKDTAYGLPVVKVTSSTGKSSNVIAAPNTYLPKLGIGFNSAGQGYSSAYAPQSNGVTKTTSSNAANALFNSNPKFN